MFGRREIKKKRGRDGVYREMNGTEGGGDEGGWGGILFERSSEKASIGPLKTMLLSIHPKPCVTKYCTVMLEAEM